MNLFESLLKTFDVTNSSRPFGQRVLIFRSISAASQDKNRLTCTPPTPTPTPPGPSAVWEKTFSQTRLPSPCQRCRWRHQQPFYKRKQCSTGGNLSEPAVPLCGQKSQPVFYFLFYFIFFVVVVRVLLFSFFCFPFALLVSEADSLYFDYMHCT